MAKDKWDPAQYDRFKNERAQPFYDLMAMVQARPGMRIYDLGCGTGELTRVLHRTLRAGYTLGIDNSKAMLGKAAGEAGRSLRFALKSISKFTTAKKADLVFSNAALQWLPNHARLLAKLSRLLKKEGQLAVQVPANHGHVSHSIARQLAAEAPFARILGRPRIPNVLGPAAYASLLHQLGFKEQRVELRVYGHLLGTREDVIEWVKGTLLTWYESRLGQDLYPRFLAEYRRRLLPELKDTRPHFYPFERILMWASR